MIQTLLDRFQKIRAFAFDLDGVLTDGTLLVFEDARYIRRMNIKDGYALQLAVKKGYPVFVISGSTGEEAVTRLRRLGVTEVYMQEKDKLERLGHLLQGHGLNWEDCLYMGDDIPDLEVMEKVGLPTAPADAASENLSLARYISPMAGGAGCVRDVIEKVLRLRGDWDRGNEIASR